MAGLARKPVSMMNAAPVSTQDLLDLRLRSKFFGARKVLGDVTLTLGQGEIVGLLGASGCGKSTLLRMIAGLDRDYDGEISLGGTRLTGVTRDVGFIFQEPRLMPWLTVDRNVAFDFKAGSDHDTVESLLQEVGLQNTGSLLPKQLSGGMAQRVSIARGLYTRPKLLLLDEPFSAVDAFTRMKLQDLLISISSQHGNSVLMVAHDVDEAAYMCDRVVVIGGQPGKITADIDVGMPRNRDRRDPRLSELRSEILDALHSIKAI